MWTLSLHKKLVEIAPFLPWLAEPVSATECLRESASQQKTLGYLLSLTSKDSEAKQIENISLNKEVSEEREMSVVLRQR